MPVSRVGTTKVDATSPHVPTRGVAVLAALLGLGLVMGFTSGPPSAATSTGDGLQPAVSTTTDRHPALIEERGGLVRAAAWDGRTAYVALHSRVLALDPLATPPASGLLGAAKPLGWRVTDLAARAPFVLAAGPELAVLDATDPARMRIVSRLPLLRPARAVAWTGDVAWLITSDDRLQRVDLSDPAAPRWLSPWRPSVPRRTLDVRFEPVDFVVYRDRLVLLARWPDATPPRRGDPPAWPGGELLLVDDAAAPEPRIVDRIAVPCCAGQLLVDENILVVVAESGHTAAWLGITPNDALSIPRLMREFADRVVLPPQDFALFDAMLWYLDRHHRVRRVRLGHTESLDPYEDLPGSSGPAVLQPTGDRLLYVVPRQAGWLMQPEDPWTMKPLRSDGPALGARAVRAMAVMTEGAYVALDDPFLGIAPREPAGTFIDDLLGLGRYDTLDELWADGDVLYARTAGRLPHWRRTGPGALHQLGELPLWSNGASHIHAISGDLFAYSSGVDLFVMRLDGEGDARRLALAKRPGWIGRTQFHDGLLWLFDQPSGVTPRMLGLHFAGGSVDMLTSSIVSPTGSVAPQLARSGTLLLVGLGSDLAVVDMRDPLRPTLLGQTDLPGTVVAVALDKTTGWAAWHEPRGTRLGLFDLSVPAFPVAAGPDVALAADPVPVDLQLWADEAWLLVDDVLQRYRIATAPPPTPTPRATVMPSASPEPSASATSRPPSTPRATATEDGERDVGQVWLPWLGRP